MAFFMLSFAAVRVTSRTAFRSTPAFLVLRGGRPVQEEQQQAGRRGRRIRDHRTARPFCAGAGDRIELLVASNTHDRGLQSTTVEDDAGDELSSMDNLYQEWTLDQDQTLWNNREKSIPVLASLLGRGLRGVESRLSKLKDVESPAYQRLFVDRKKNGTAGDEHEWNKTSSNKLVPASEVLRRIQWDYSLSPTDFSILHYDRVDDNIVETAMDAPNDSIAGKATSFVDALPEHRIVAIKYKERVVWDREKRIDRVFANEGIAAVMEHYEAWKRERDNREAWDRQRRDELTQRLQQILGLERFGVLQELSSDLQSSLSRTSSSNDPTLSPPKLEVEKYVRAALEVFREVREDPAVSLMPQAIPRSDLEALDTLSELLVALLPDAPALRAVILDELSTRLQQQLGGTKVNKPDKKKNGVAMSATAVFNRPLPEIREEDLTETFIRGTGPGGQKINKTSNRVLLVHKPTQLRVECQETRSLPDNRRIARKRLRQKLDDYLHGSQSKASVKAQKISTKKSKSKARSRKRHRQKQEEKQGSSSATTVDGKEDDPFGNL